VAWVVDTVITFGEKMLALGVESMRVIDGWGLFAKISKN
jgi:hypothetical protein